MSSGGYKDTGRVQWLEYSKETAALQMIYRTNPGGEAAELLTRSEVQNELVSFLKLLDSKVIGLFLQTNRNCLKRADFVQIRSAR